LGQAFKPRVIANTLVPGKYVDEGLQWAVFISSVQYDPL